MTEIDRALQWLASQLDNIPNGIFTTTRQNVEAHRAATAIRDLRAERDTLLARAEAAEARAKAAEEREKYSDERFREIERLYYAEGKDLSWRAAHMRAIAEEHFALRDKKGAGG